MKMKPIITSLALVSGIAISGLALASTNTTGNTLSASSHGMTTVRIVPLAGKVEGDPCPPVPFSPDPSDICVYNLSGQDVYVTIPDFGDNNVPVYSDNTNYSVGVFTYGFSDNPFVQIIGYYGNTIFSQQVGDYSSIEIDPGFKTKIITK